MLILRANQPPSGASGSHTFTVGLRPPTIQGMHRFYVRLGREEVQGSHAFLVRLTANEVRGEHRFFVGLRLPGDPATAMPVQVRGGIPFATWSVSCQLGNAVKANYEHSGDDETGTMTLRVGPERVGAKISFKAQLGADGAAIVRQLTVDKDQEEVTWDREGVTTVIRFFNPTAKRVKSFRLPELVSWVLSPRAEYPNDFILEPGVSPSPTLPAPPPLRRIGVSELVRRCFAAAGVAFSLAGPDPFEGETWVEKRRETSTGGRTCAEVFNATYGSLGYRLIVRGSSVFGVAPGASIDGGSLSFTRCELTRRKRRKEAARVPGMIAVSAADAVVLAPKPLPGSLGGSTTTYDPVKEEAEEPAPETRTPEDEARSWLTMTPGENGLDISAGFVWNGLLREEQSITIGRVEVKETVEGEVQTRVFDRVLISDTKTTYRYHPDCQEAVTQQVTSKRGYAYGLGTQVRMVGIVGQLFGGQFTAGDLVTSEVERITQVWYEQGSIAGYLKSRLTEGVRLVSVQQEGAEDEPSQRGPMQAREYVPQNVLEQYRYLFPLWERQVSTTGGATVPLYDLDTQEPIRLAVRTGALSTSTELMLNEPPKVNWPVAEAPEKPEDPTAPEDPDDDAAPTAAERLTRGEVNIPQRALFTVAGGGEDTLEANFPMLATPAKLAAFAGLLAHSNGPRTVHELELEVPRGALPGSAISGTISGVVAGLSISTEGAKGTASITAEELTAPTLTEIPIPPENDREKGTVVNVNGRRVIVAIAKGVEDGEGVFVPKTAYLLPGMTVSLRSTVEIRPNADGLNIVASGAS